MEDPAQSAKRDTSFDLQLLNQSTTAAATFAFQLRFSNQQRTSRTAHDQACITALQNGSRFVFTGWPAA
ncbi:MAG: Uncharacterised protein [Cyanobium sp. ARS6]|nr:MAG: Uncharacterised protein [Cyanobium sp. ARS6]